MRPPLVTTKLTPATLRLVRLIAAATGERQHVAVGRLVRAEAERLGLADVPGGPEPEPRSR